MNTLFRRWLPLAAVLPVALTAGSLVLEIGNPQANPEAKKIHAVLLARATACHEPGKSTVTANLVALAANDVQRTPLKVVRLSTPGTFAVVGSIPSGDSAIELTLTNPEYGDYAPRVLVRANDKGVQWGTLRRFREAPTVSEVKTVLAMNNAGHSGL
jgi:hypothetical protein